MIIEYLPIKKDILLYRPDRFKIKLNKNDYVFEVSWNNQGDFFAFHLFDREMNPFLFG